MLDMALTMISAAAGACLSIMNRVPVGCSGQQANGSVFFNFLQYVNRALV
jgi:hypothetical protein